MSLPCLTHRTAVLVACLVYAVPVISAAPPPEVDQAIRTMKDPKTEFSLGRRTAIWLAARGAGEEAVVDWCAAQQVPTFAPIALLGQKATPRLYALLSDDGARARAVEMLSVVPPPDQDKVRSLRAMRAAGKLPDPALFAVDLLIASGLGAAERAAELRKLEPQFEAMAEKLPAIYALAAGLETTRDWAMPALRKRLVKMQKQKATDEPGMLDLVFAVAGAARVKPLEADDLKLVMSLDESPRLIPIPQGLAWISSKRGAKELDALLGAVGDDSGEVRPRMALTMYLAELALSPKDAGAMVAAAADAKRPTSERKGAMLLAIYLAPTDPQVRGLAQKLAQDDDLGYLAASMVSNWCVEVDGSPPQEKNGRDRQ